MKIIIKQLGLLVLIGLIAVGCDKNPVSHGGDHTDTDGFILKDENGNGLYREFKGAIDINNINLIVGDTLELSVHFLDHEGNEIQHGEDEEDHEDELIITENDTSIAIIEVEKHEEGENDHEGEEEHYEIAIHIIGISAGSSSFKLELMHGDHADYTSINNVSFNVTE